MTIAEEIEQSGLAGRVVISGPTHSHCHEAFVCRTLKPLTRSATLATIPRYEVLQAVSGSKRREREMAVSSPRSSSASERVELELSALPTVVLDILHKVRAAANGAAEEGAAASLVSIDGREQQLEVAAAAAARNTNKHQSTHLRDRPISDATLVAGRSQMDGHRTPLLTMEDRVE